MRLNEPHSCPGRETGAPPSLRTPVAGTGVFIFYPKPL